MNSKRIKQLFSGLIVGFFFLSANTVYAGKKFDIKSFKKLAVVKVSGKCDAKNIVGQISINVQRMVNNVYDEVIKQLTDAGLVVVDSDTVKKAAMSASGEQEVPANMPAWMKKMQEANEQASEQKASKDGDLSFERDAKQSERIGSLLPYEMNIKRKSKDEKTKKFYTAIDQMGADGFLVVNLFFQVEIPANDKEKLNVNTNIQAVVYDGQGKKVYERLGQREQNMMNDPRGRGTWLMNWLTLDKTKTGKFTNADAEELLQKMISITVEAMIGGMGLISEK